MALRDGAGAFPACECGGAVHKRSSSFRAVSHGHGCRRRRSLTLRAARRINGRHRRDRTVSTSAISAVRRIGARALAARCRRLSVRRLLQVRPRQPLRHDGYVVLLTRVSRAVDWCCLRRYASTGPVAPCSSVTTIPWRRPGARAGTRRPRESSRLRRDFFRERYGLRGPKQVLQAPRATPRSS